MFPVLIAIGRIPGRLARWNEMIQDEDRKTARPRQVDLGHRNPSFVPLEKRD